MSALALSKSPLVS
uniref:Uncharacterized protein n=1 Tax=Anguilla anguilla TaxID=7936 RepID=A0A0E9VRB2_ANGAN